MKHTLDMFYANTTRVRSLHALHQNFVGLVAPIVDLSDLLRAEIVLIVSALDHFIHELAKAGMMDIWQGGRQPTPTYLKFEVSLNFTTQIATGVAAASHLETEIRTRHSFISFQMPDNIADAVRLFSTIELWNEVGENLAEDPKDIKSRLRLLVDRRNKIAHEADIAPSYPGQRWPIIPKDTEEALDFMEKIGESIYNVSV